MLHGALFIPLMMTDDRDSDSVSVCVMNDELGPVSRTPIVSLKLSLSVVFVMFSIHHPLQHEVSDAVPGPEASAALLSRPPHSPTLDTESNRPYQFNFNIPS